MASPGDKKGQHKGSCGHIMASFDSHNKCARCRHKRIGEDNCVLDKPCPIFDAFSNAQKELLATPSYRIRKDKKAGLLVSPKDVTVISSVDTVSTLKSPSGPSVQSSAQLSTSIPPTMASSSAQPTSFVTSEQFIAMSDKWAEQFAHMEALLSCGNIFTTPVSTVKPVDSQHLMSETLFLAPATHHTSPVTAPVAVHASVKAKPVEHKDKKKTHKSRKSDCSVDKDSKTDMKSDKKRDTKSHKKRDRSASPPQSNLLQLNRDILCPLQLILAPESAKQLGAVKLDAHQPSSGSKKDSTGPTGHASSVSHQPSYG